MRTQIQTIRLCEIIACIISEFDPEKYFQDLSRQLNVSPPDLIFLLKRVGSPQSKPIFDGVHDHQDWYDNDLQMSRIFLALINILGLEENLPRKINETCGLTADISHELKLHAQSKIDRYAKSRK